MWPSSLRGIFNKTGRFLGSSSGLVNQSPPRLCSEICELEKPPQENVRPESPPPTNSSVSWDLHAPICCRGSQPQQPNWSLRLQLESWLSSDCRLLLFPLECVNPRGKLVLSPGAWVKFLQNNFPQTLSLEPGTNLTGFSLITALTRPAFLA